jgi:hypothetical protein
MFSYVSTFNIIILFISTRGLQYIPIFYQAVRHHSATKSGIDLLPFMLGLVVTVIISGQIVGKTGY